MTHSSLCRCQRRRIPHLLDRMRRRRNLRVLGLSILPPAQDRKDSRADQSQGTDYSAHSNASLGTTAQTAVVVADGWCRTGSAVLRAGF